MRVMTFNLRFKNDRDGEHHWDARKQIVADIFRRYDPDVVGTQEGYKSQIQDIHNLAKSYLYLDQEHLLSEERQCPTILYRPDRLLCESGGTFWLSETPSIVDSKSWESAFPRMLTYGRFRYREGGFRFLFLDTHLDHVSALARREGVQLILDLIGSINKEGLPTILVGDFNLAPDTSEYATLTQPADPAPLVDVWRAAGESETNAETRHAFDGIGKYYRMDWILASPSVMVKRAEIIRDHASGRYPSDHFPVIAELSF